MTSSKSPRHQTLPTAEHNAAVPSLERMLLAQDEEFALCRALEDIADSLPANIDRLKCLHAAGSLMPLIRGAHAYEQDVFFRWLQDSGLVDPGLKATLSRLLVEHCEDECYAEDVADALLKLGHGADVNVEATGYMLRGFFEARRRHIAFEREHLLRYVRP